jgi:phosphomannomutase
MTNYDVSIFRAYDIRGIYPDQMNEQVAYAAGQGFVTILNAKKVVVGRDVRATGLSLQNALIEGITDAGADVIEVGVISTEMLYFAAGSLECDGGMSVTASHNPAQWNGIKMCGEGAKPLTTDAEMGEIYEYVKSGESVKADSKGSVEHVDLLPQYVHYLQKYMPKDAMHMKVAANPNFGANGKVVEEVCKSLPVELVRLNWEEDGTFPKGTPDPLLPSNRREVGELIVSSNSDFGVAWDADADRCFFYDEKGRFFHSYYITALLISHFLTIEPGASIVTDPRLTWASLDAIAAGGGKAVESRVGHSFFKKNMRASHAIFAGEISGHYYFRDFFFCDNGIISFITVLNIFSEQLKKGGTVSMLLDHYLEHYPIVQQELNFITPRALEIIETIKANHKDAEQSTLDGLSVEYPQWRFNIRVSANEPIMRVNLEARNPQELAQREEELMSFLNAEGAVLRDDSK